MVLDTAKSYCTCVHCEKVVFRSESPDLILRRTCHVWKQTSVSGNQREPKNIHGYMTYKASSIRQTKVGLNAKYVFQQAQSFICPKLPPFK